MQKLVLPKIQPHALAKVQRQCGKDIVTRKILKRLPEVFSVEVKPYFEQVHIDQCAHSVAELPATTIRLTRHVPFLAAKAIKGPGVIVISDALATDWVAAKHRVGPAHLN